MNERNCGAQSREAVGAMIGRAEATMARPSPWPGFVLAGAIAAAAYALCKLPIPPFRMMGPEGVRHPVSAAIVAILLGVVAANVTRLPAVISAGCKRIVRYGIPFAIVAAGAELDLAKIAAIGPTALCITIVCMIVAVAAGYYGGRALGLGGKVAMLIGAGTGVCGNSAIVAVAPLIDAEDEDLVLSIGTVNLYGLLAMLACPLLGGLFGLTQSQFGVWVGASIHAIPQVVAAGFTRGVESGTLATAVKLVRVAMLAPLVFLLAMSAARRKVDVRAAKGIRLLYHARFVPWFVWGFLGMSALGTFGLIPELHFGPSGPLSKWISPFDYSLTSVLTWIGKVLLTWAMAAIGLEVNLRALVAVSGRALILGLLASVALAGASLALICILM